MFKKKICLSSNLSKFTPSWLGIDRV